MNAIAQDTEWNPFGPPLTAAEGAPPPVVTEAVTTPTTEPVHRPALRLADVPLDRRAVVVPTKKAMKNLLKIEDTAYAPPFWVGEGGEATTDKTDLPLCPPIEVGGKAMVLDDWKKPKVVEVTGMHEGQIEALYGTVPIRCKAWLAVNDKAVIDSPLNQRPGRLSDEEAAALEAEIMEWSKFLGYRAEKHRWCETFESILMDMGIEPWRPGFKSVTLQVYTELPAAAVKDALAERMGGEIKAERMTAVGYVDIEDVSREDFKSSRFTEYLKAKGFNVKNITQIYVHAKEPMPL